MSDRVGRDAARRCAADSTFEAVEGVSADLMLAKIRLLYESRDGKLCLFEDAQGHLTAVRSVRLA